MKNIYEILGFSSSEEEDLNNDAILQNWLEVVGEPQKKLTSGVALVDLDGTIRQPESNSKFINNPLDQKLIGNVGTVLRCLNLQRIAIYAVSNQGGIEAGYKTLRSTIKEMRQTLKLTKYIDRIYFAVNDRCCWVVTRKFAFLDFLPLWLNTFSRYEIENESLGDPKYLLGGFRKPNPGMLRLAIADWCNNFDILNFDAFAYINNENFVQTRLSDKKIFMTGDRTEDDESAVMAGVDFVAAKDFQQGCVPWG